MFEYGLFLAKIVTVVAAIAVIIVIATVSSKGGKSKGSLKLLDITDTFDNYKAQLEHQLLSEEQLKAQAKQQKAEAKRKAKESKGQERRGRLFVIDFKAGIDAAQVANLREEISALLTVADKDKDELLVKVESGGGMVHAYGLAASQLDRVRQAQIPMTIAVDKVAASGGYMMACVANKIIAAPFAIVGSIGVIAQLPNFNKVLKKNDIDFEMHTAGDFKRTITMFGENTDEGRAKFKEELEHTHQLFKAFVGRYRPELDIAKVATGEHWFGQQAMELGLVDELSTSDDFLMNADKPIIQLQYEKKQNLAQKLGRGAEAMVERSMLKLSELTANRWS